MSENRQGQVVTFYSFKGGTGRTMALANVAWILAANGYRVLVADWDLESPGLHRFFHPFIDARQLDNAEGVIHLIREYEWASTTKEERGEDWYKSYAKVSRYALSLTADFPGMGGIDLLAAGVQRLDYAKSVYSIDWDTFHDQLNGGRFLDALRADMKNNYDFALIDSRTGFSDVADICTIHLPDILVDCFTYSSQGLDGAAQVASVIRTTYHHRQIRIFPVPMRVDPAEKAKEDLGRALAMQKFAGLPVDMSDQERATYWVSVAVPYYAFYAYEETLATFADEPGSPRSMLFAYETLTRYITQHKITGLPPMDRTDRERIKAKFERATRKAESEIALRYQPADKVWAEWVEAILLAANVRVFSSPGTPQGEPPTAREMRIISARNEQLGSVQMAPPRGEQPLVVYVDNVRPSHGSAPETYQFVNNLAESAAVQRILELVGRAGEEIGESSVRYPGSDPAIFKAPAHNSHFTGREEDLLRLRQQLLGGKGRIAVVSGAVTTVSLQGMGGIGKTWLALEYAYRYRSAYDIVWWVRSDPPAFVDTELADLGRRLNLLANQPQANAAEMVRATLRALEAGEPHRRWLVIFDNAEDIERIGPFLPRQGGHLLITSRDPAWSEHSQRLTLDVFRREESIAHLHSRIPTIKLDEADGVAAMLGDLPIAVAAAAAWLADTGTPVADYLRQLEEQGANDPSVEKTWDLSLQRLRERSPAAFRLFQLCSVMGPEIHTDLIYSDRMAEALARFDPTVVDRQVRGRLVQQINKLALLKVDVSNSQLLVHRVLQTVVRARMTEEEQIEARHEVHRVLAAARPDGEIDDSTKWRRYQQLWPHLDVSKATECNDEDMRELLIARVRFLYLATGSDEDHAEAKNLAERVEVTWQGQLAAAEDDATRRTIRRQLLHMRFNLANIIRETGDFERSHQLNQETHAEQVELLTAQHPHTLMTAGGLAADLRALGRYAEALDRDQITYDAWAESFGPDYTRTLATLNNLAASHRHMGNYSRAQELDEEVWRRRRVVSGETHAATLVTASNLGRDYREAGDYDASVELLRRTVDQLQRTYGGDSRTTLNVQANLAVSLRSAGVADEAGQLLDTAYLRLIDTAGPTAPDTLACRLSRAVNLLALATARSEPSEVQRSMEELERVRDGYVAFVGRRHPHTLLCVNNLAAVARAAGLLDQAREFAMEASGVLTEVLGPRHPYTLAARMNLGICLAETNELPDAVELMQEVAELLAVALGPEHPDTVRCRANVVLGQLSLGLQHSEKAHVRVLTQLTERLGVDHPAVKAMQERRYLHRIVEPHPF